MHALAPLGTVQSESALANGRRPDIVFHSEALSFTADVTTVSDDGVDDQNPVFQLNTLLEQLKTRLRLTMGGAELRVHSREDVSREGNRTTLRLPPSRRLSEFVRRRIEPELRAQISEGRRKLRISIDDDEAGLDLLIDPDKSPYNSVGHASYNAPTRKTSNPFYNALKAKARQLRFATGHTGVIVGDGGSASLRDRHLHRDGVDAGTIAQEFLRQHRSITFVLVLTVREEACAAGSSPKRMLDARMAVQPGFPANEALKVLIERMIRNMPFPVATASNAAFRAQEHGYGWGYHGGYEMSRDGVKIGSRVLMEFLAGRLSLEEFNGLHGWHPAGTRRDKATTVNPFALALGQGRLPKDIVVIRTSENDADDWVNIRFGEADPAISPFK
jgi:hypothetical protein